MEVLHLFQTLAHRAHLSREQPEGFHQDPIFQVLHDLLTIRNRVQTIQRKIIEGCEIVILPVGDNAVDDLLKIQVSKKGGRFLRLFY
jgi:hypothetical protein